MTSNQPYIEVTFDPAVLAMERLNQKRGYTQWPSGKSKDKEATLAADAFLIRTTELRKKFHLRRKDRTRTTITPGVERFSPHPRGLTDIPSALAALKEVPSVTDARVNNIDLGYLRFQFSPTPQLTESFNNLPDDSYAKQALRQRRFSQFRASHTKKGWRFQTLKHRPFVQSAEDNPLVGGVARHFEPLECDVNPLLAGMLQQLGSNSEEAFHIDVHQYRVFTQDGQAGSPVPEGAHQDGHNIVGIMVIKRHNITGGKTTVTNLDGQEVTAAILQEGDAFFLKDPEYYHDTSQITATTEGKGYRDVFVINVNPWDERRYGAEFARRSGVSKEEYDQLAL